MDHPPVPLFVGPYRDHTKPKRGRGNRSQMYRPVIRAEPVTQESLPPIELKTRQLHSQYESYIEAKQADYLKDRRPQETKTSKHMTPMPINPESIGEDILINFLCDNFSFDPLFAIANYCFNGVISRRPTDPKPHKFLFFLSVPLSRCTKKLFDFFQSHEYCAEYMRILKNESITDFIIQLVKIDEYTLPYGFHQKMTKSCLKKRAYDIPIQDILAKLPINITLDERDPNILKQKVYQHKRYTNYFKFICWKGDIADIAYYLDACPDPMDQTLMRFVTECSVLTQKQSLTLFLLQKANFSVDMILSFFFQHVLIKDRLDVFTVYAVCTEIMRRTSCVPGFLPFNSFIGKLIGWFELNPITHLVWGIIDIIGIENFFIKYDDYDLIQRELLKSFFKKNYSTAFEQSDSVRMNDFLTLCRTGFLDKPSEGETNSFVRVPDAYDLVCKNFFSGLVPLILPLTLEKTTPHIHIFNRLMTFRPDCLDDPQTVNKCWSALLFSTLTTVTKDIHALISQLLSKTNFHFCDLIPSDEQIARKIFEHVPQSLDMAYAQGCDISFDRFVFVDKSIKHRRIELLNHMLQNEKLNGEMTFYLNNYIFDGIKSNRDIFDATNLDIFRLLVSDTRLIFSSDVKNFIQRNIDAEYNPRLAQLRILMDAEHLRFELFFPQLIKYTSLAKYGTVPYAFVRQIVSNKKICSKYDFQQIRLSYGKEDKTEIEFDNIKILSKVQSELKLN